MKKVAATLSSTGTPAFFLHPAEAVHGDLGMIVPGDVVLAASYSGTTEELLRLVETLKRLGVPLVAMTANAASPARPPRRPPPAGGDRPRGLPAGPRPHRLDHGDPRHGGRPRHGARRGARLHPRGLRPPPPRRPARQAAAQGRAAHARGRRPAQGRRSTRRCARRSTRCRGRGWASPPCVDAEGRLAGCISDGDLRRLLQTDDGTDPRPHRRRAHDAPIRAPSPAASWPRRPSRSWRTTASPPSSSATRRAGSKGWSTSTTSGAWSCSRHEDRRRGAGPPGAGARLAAVRRRRRADRRLAWSTAPRGSSGRSSTSATAWA